MNGRRLLPTLVALILALPVVSEAAVTVEYQVLPDCPDRDSFVDLIERRIRSQGKTGRLPELKVSLEKIDAQYRGLLTMRQAGSPDAVRQIDGETCSQVVDAMALIAVLSIMPEAAPTERWQFLVGGRVGGFFGTVPDFAFGFDVYAEARRENDRFYDPIFRLGFARAQAEKRVSAGSADFVWMVARLDVCPLRARFAKKWFTTAACARLELGSLSAAGHNIVNALDVTRFYGDLGVAGQAIFVPWRRIEIEADFGLTFPFFHDRFFFRPATTLYEVPAAATTLSLGVRVLLGTLSR